MNKIKKIKKHYMQKLQVKKKSNDNMCLHVSYLHMK